MTTHSAGRLPASGGRVTKSMAIALLPLALLAGCGDDDESIQDIDAAENQVLESAMPGTSVGLSVGVEPGYSRYPVAYSLPDDAAGAFAIDATSGVVSLAAAVDYEASAERTVVAQARVMTARGLMTFKRRFKVAVLDSPAPSLTLTFPFAHARYADPALSVSGRVAHPQLENVRVTARAGAAEIEGEIVDGWFSIRDLQVAGAGQFTLTVDATHPGGDRTTRTFTLSREPELTDVPRIVLDSPRSRVLMVDIGTAAIVAASLDGAARTTVSDRNVGTGPALVEPLALTLNASGNTLYVADGGRNEIFSVQLATGDRSILPASGATFFNPSEMDFDATRNRIILSDEYDGVLAIDAVSGQRQLISSRSSPGPEVYNHRGIAFDAQQDRILVANFHSLFAVDPVTGARALISDGYYEPTSRFLQGMTLAAESGVVYLGEEMTNGVLRIDLATGARQEMTASGLPAPWNIPAVGAGAELQYPDDVVFDEASRRLFLIEGEYADPLVEVAANGDRTVVRDASLGTGVHFRAPSGIKYDADRRRLLVADYVADFVATIDPASGNRILVSGRGDGRGTIDTDLVDVSFSAATGLYYVIDRVTRSLYSVNQATGELRTIANATTGSGPLLYYPERVEIDDARGLAYVLGGGAILAVDLATGVRRVLSDGFSTFGGGMAFDPTGHTLYVADGNTGSIFSIDVVTGARRTIVGGLSFHSQGGIAYDSANHRIIATEQYSSRLWSIDVATTQRSLIAGPTAPGAVRHGPDLLRLHSVVVDSERQIAWVTDDAYDAVIAVDLRTGDRQLIAK